MRLRAYLLCVHCILSDLTVYIAEAVNRLGVTILTQTCCGPHLRASSRGRNENEIGLCQDRNMLIVIRKHPIGLI